jgi:hypothetical protein
MIFQYSTYAKDYEFRSLSKTSSIDSEWWKVNEDDPLNFAKKFKIKKERCEFHGPLRQDLRSLYAQLPKVGKEDKRIGFASDKILKNFELAEEYTTTPTEEDPRHLLFNHYMIRPADMLRARDPVQDACLTIQVAAEEDMTQRYTLMNGIRLIAKMVINYETNATLDNLFNANNNKELVVKQFKDASRTAWTYFVTYRTKQWQKESGKLDSTMINTFPDTVRGALIQALMVATKRLVFHYDDKSDQAVYEILIQAGILDQKGWSFIKPRHCGKVLLAAETTLCGINSGLNILYTFAFTEFVQAVSNSSNFVSLNNGATNFKVPADLALSPYEWESTVRGTLTALSLTNYILSLSRYFYHGSRNNARGIDLLALLNQFSMSLFTLQRISAPPSDCIVAIMMSMFCLEAIGHLFATLFSKNKELHQTFVAVSLGLNAITIGESFWDICFWRHEAQNAMLESISQYNTHLKNNDVKDVIPLCSPPVLKSFKAICFQNVWGLGILLSNFAKEHMLVQQLEPMLENMRMKQTEFNTASEAEQQAARNKSATDLDIKNAIQKKENAHERLAFSSITAAGSLIVCSGAALLSGPFAPLALVGCVGAGGAVGGGAFVLHKANEEFDARMPNHEAQNEAKSKSWDSYWRWRW